MFTQFLDTYACSHNSWTLCAYSHNSWTLYTCLHNSWMLHTCSRISWTLCACSHNSWEQCACSHRSRTLCVCSNNSWTMCACLNAPRRCMHVPTKFPRRRTDAYTIPGYCTQLFSSFYIILCVHRSRTFSSQHSEFNQRRTIIRTAKAFGVNRPIS